MRGINSAGLRLIEIFTGAATSHYTDNKAGKSRHCKLQLKTLLYVYIH